MKVQLAYGTEGLEVDVPDDATVVEASDPAPLADERGAVLAALRRPLATRPLAQMVRPGSRVAVVFPDLTRPMPNRTVLPPLLDELAEAGVVDTDVTLLCATGSHRQATPDEMAALITPKLADRYRVHDHQGADLAAHVEVGQVDGVPILLDRHYVEADVRIVTGFVEPHFFAGWSGGPKGVCPGLAALPTILEAHRPERIAHPLATWGVTEGNPVHDFVRVAAGLSPPDLSIDVTIDGMRRLTSVHAGQVEDAHLAARHALLATAAELPRAGGGHHAEDGFDVVVSTNGGYPLDRNLYQAVKGMAAAERMVRPGGTIVMAAECRDGVPAGSFERLLVEARTPEELLEPTGPNELDRWQAQVLGRVLRRARVSLHSGGLGRREIEAAQLHPAPDMSAAVATALAAAGPAATVAVVPRGPLTLMVGGP